jgi:vacuolar protein sorting-associated protein 45
VCFVTNPWSCLCVTRLGVQNVYTEHKPLLKKLLDQVFAGKLPEETFPYANIDGRVDHKHTAQSPPKEVIVFFVGGCTFEEALCIHQFNNQHKQAVESSASAAGTARGPKVSIVLGGTTIHNSKSFMRDLQKLQELS